MGLKANFTILDIQNFVKSKRQIIDQTIIQRYQFAGDQFVINARTKTETNGGFGDITGNLRSSIGYIILKDGKVITSEFQEAATGSDRVTGVTAGESIAEEVGAKYPKGFVLIAVAGMSYAAAVESKGKDVITGSAQQLETDLRSLFD